MAGKILLRRLAAGCGLAAALAAGAAAAQAPLQIPRAYWGEYSAAVASCGQQGADGRIVISATKLTFGESSATLKELIVRPDGGIVAMAEFAGEGERWSSMRAFQLSPDRATLTMWVPHDKDSDQQEVRSTRCAAR
jgi:hypothetical protein